WAAEPLGVRPYGLRPYKCREELESQSKVVTDCLNLSDDPHSLQRLRDLKVHILEQRHRRSGFYWAELIEKYRRHDQLRWFLDAKVNDYKLDFSARAFEHRSIGGETGIIITRNSDAVVGEGIDSNIADQAGFKFEEVNSTVGRRRKRPPRERSEPG